MSAEVFREMVKCAGLTSQNPGRWPQWVWTTWWTWRACPVQSPCHAGRMDENFAHKLHAILIMYANLNECLLEPFVPILSSLYFLKYVPKYQKNSAWSNEELKKKSGEDIQGYCLCKSLALSLWLPTLPQLLPPSSHTQNSLPHPRSRIGNTGNEMNISSCTTMTLLKANTDLRCFNHDPDSSRSQGFCDCYGNLFRQALLNCGCGKELSLGVWHKELNVFAVSRIYKNLKKQTSERCKSRDTPASTSWLCLLPGPREAPVPTAALSTGADEGSGSRAPSSSLEGMD